MPSAPKTAAEIWSQDRSLRQPLSTKRLNGKRTFVDGLSILVQRKLMADERIHWDGLGRWLAFAAAGILIVLSVPAVFSLAFGAVAGWNIFLGLLLIGVVVSGHRKAPLFVAILVALVLLRLVLSLIFGILIDAGLNFLLLSLLGGAWKDLREQAEEI